jgi:DNA-binding XRE family transcriptional regulator
MKQFQFKKIKEFREAAGLTQPQLAKRSASFLQQISAWENSDGDKSMTTGIWLKIADALGKNTEWIFLSRRTIHESKGKGGCKGNQGMPHLAKAERQRTGIVWGGRTTGQQVTPGHNLRRKGHHG